MSRIADTPYERMDAEQRRVHDLIAKGPRGGVRGPLRIWLKSPVLAERLQHLGELCRYRTSLPPRLSELAILVTARAWRSGYEWAAHAPIAIEAGLDAAAVEAIRTGARPALTRADEVVTHAFAQELHERQRVSDATYASAVEVLGEAAVIELVAVLGYYTTVAMTLNAFEVDLPEGVPEPFPDRPSHG